MYGSRIVMNDPRGYLTEEQVTKLINATENKRDLALFLVMYRCGRRVSEVLSLKREHIIWAENRIIFRILKKRKFYQEVKPVDKQTMKTLKQYCDMPYPENLKGDHETYLFPVSRQYVFKLIRQLGAKVGIIQVGRKKLHPHHLRHSFAVHQVKNNVKTIEQLRMLQRYMGHTDIGMTAHYLQFSTDDMKEIPDMWDKVDNSTNKSTK